MVQQEGNEFWVVSCIACGGRPDADISLAFSADEELQREDDYGPDTHTRLYRLPAAVFEGRNITCVFQHPKFPHRESRVITLPSFYLSGIKLFHSGMRNGSIQRLELQEGRENTVIDLEVTGNVPHYTVSCKKDDGPLPEGVEMSANSLTVEGLVDSGLAGMYECVASYHRHKAALQFNITVQPPVTQPVPPTIRVDLQTEDGGRLVACSAADGVPAASVSWLLPEGVSGLSWFNFTSHNGSHSVRGLLLLPACSPREFTAECLINHPAFQKPENRSVTLPLCARPDISINSSGEWRGGEWYTEVSCWVKSVSAAATISWQLGNGDNSAAHLREMVTQPEVQADGSLMSHSAVQFKSSLFWGQNLSCVVQHPSLEVPEERTMHIPVPKAPELAVSVERQQDSLLWLAACDLRGEGVGSSLAWILPENTKGQTSLHSEYEGRVLKSRLTYQFPLSLHEGQNLTCVNHHEHRITQKKTIHIPRYYISSVRVLNHTTPLQSRYGGRHAIRGLALRENHRNQKILLQVNGNTPEYNLTCQRADGSFVEVEEAALVLQSEEEDEDVYTCRASFYHHQATVSIQVELISADGQLTTLCLIFISSASAVTIVVVVTLWVFCKRSNESQCQEPGSPDVQVQQEHAQLIAYSIIIDVKSTV
ncbi:hypothetical protein LDENG_00210090 [Lucifuga dentata]|nr:hypothetical protein LDENG_00210090 [Lucifuga dentata]